jgi:hypothetical protein
MKEGFVMLILLMDAKGWGECGRVPKQTSSLFSMSDANLFGDQLYLSFVVTALAGQYLPAKAVTTN